MTTSDNRANDAVSEAPVRERRSRGALTFLRDVVVIILIALLVSFLVKTFLVRSFYIPSASMEHTLIEQDRILVDELTPRFGGYDRGDVVVFRDPGGWLSPQMSVPSQGPFVDAVEWVLSLVGLAAPDSDDHLIKRIIGLPGDHVVCCNELGQITVNGTPIDETSYTQLPEAGAPASGVDFDITVPANSLWVMGDNRYRSQDSRFQQDQPGKGFVPVDNVVGRAFVITWPIDRWGGIDFHHDVFGAVPAPGEDPAP